MYFTIYSYEWNGFLLLLKGCKKSYTGFATWDITVADFLIFEEIDQDDDNNTNQIPITFEIPSREIYCIWELLGYCNSSFVMPWDG